MIESKFLIRKLRNKYIKLAKCEVNLTQEIITEFLYTKVAIDILKRVILDNEFLQCFEIKKRDKLILFQKTKEIMRKIKSHYDKTKSFKLDVRAIIAYGLYKSIFIIEKRELNKNDLITYMGVSEYKFNEMRKIFRITNYAKMSFL